jgi:ABC-2 type transport system ATP-binding protein
MAAVDVESLTITYGSVTAVDDLSFHADAGEVTCVLGPNGAGKTSTVEALEGLRRPTSGRLSVVGLDPRADHQALTERIGVMLQEGGIHPAVRVHEALRHAAALYRDPVAPRTLVDRLGLGGLERRTYRQLSGGEQRRVALALALVGRPQVAFLDEPTAGVDPAGRRVIRQVIAELRNDGVTVLLTTHDLDEAERVADRVVIVVGGRLVATGTVDELTRSSGADERVRFRAPAGLDRGSLARRLGGVDIVETAPGDYAVATAPTPQAVAAITAWLADHDLSLSDLRAGRQRLEDVYLELTADAPPAREPGRKRRPPEGPNDAGTAHAGHDIPASPGGSGAEPRPGALGPDQLEPGEPSGDTGPGEFRPGEPRPGALGPGEFRPGEPRPGDTGPGEVRPEPDGPETEADDPTAPPDEDEDEADGNGDRSAASAFEAFWGKGSLDSGADWTVDEPRRDRGDRR